MSTFISILKDHWEWRKQIVKLAKSDIIKTYSGAALGWSWAIIKPLITVTVYWFAFSIGLRMSSAINGYPYVLWLIAGIVPWFYISEMITQGTECIRKYRFLVTKMKFPVSTIPTFIAMSKMVVHLILLVIVMLIFICTGHRPDIYWLQIPIYMFLMFICAVCWALFSAMLAAISVDFLNLVKSIVTAIFWMSGIMWDVNSIHIGWLQTVLQFNPVTFLATGYRNCFIYKVWIWEQPLSFLYFLIVLILLGIGAVWAYKKLYKEIPDVL